MQSKTEKVISFLQSRDYKGALAIARGFKVGFTKGERRILQIASDVENGNDRIYIQIGINVTEIVNNAKRLLIERYGKSI